MSNDDQELLLGGTQSIAGPIQFSEPWKIQYSVHYPLNGIIKELQSVFPNLELWKQLNAEQEQETDKPEPTEIATKELKIIATFQQSAADLVDISDETEVERNRMFDNVRTLKVLDCILKLLTVVKLYPSPSSSSSSSPCLSFSVCQMEWIGNGQLGKNWKMG
eukprot:TRINITY_DN3850_c0_g1_i1.p1 TRINITY_DN3850_c0_g1~~TRINITY_DN3850_c0_g1_i1.p1  ORF type:complete len:163 (+),score=48.63 TRINITY_DN3850_c0_g1_i1:28-516(+)